MRMEFLRRATNPWGQEILVGIAWDLMWAALAAGLAFVAGHAVYAWWESRAKLAGAAGAAVGAADPGEAQAVPELIQRHSAGARAFHWLMAIAMFTLLVTAFFPVVGIRFPWVTIHWLAGIGLILTVLYHIVHALFVLDWRAMWVERADVADAVAFLSGLLRRGAAVVRRAGKYPFDHKLYHHAVTVVTLAAIATGVAMMFRIDTPFWDPNPYFLSDRGWGMLYVVHGISGVALITLVIAHVYFAVRPEKWWLTRSMIKGWITRAEYLAHHDPARWRVARSIADERGDAARARTAPAVGGGAGTR